MERPEYILTNATQLFNRQGATPTSLRQVASYLDMSDGNLRYHFKSKEALVTAIFYQMQAELEEVVQARQRGKEAPLIEDMRKQYRIVFYTMYRYKFLFLESTLLLNQYPAFKKAFLKHMRTRREFFLHFIREYRNKGFFQANHGEDYFDRLFEQIFIISDNWIKYVELEASTSPSSMDKKIDHYIELCMSLIETALTEEGKTQLSR